MRRCKAITTRGRRCRIQVPEDQEFCHFHHEKRLGVAEDEERQEEASSSEVKTDTHLPQHQEREVPSAEQMEPEGSESEEVQVWEDWLSPLVVGIFLALLIVLSWWMVK